MAFKHGRFAEIVISGTNLSEFCDTADINIDVETAELSMLGGEAWKRHLVGLAGGTVDGGGAYDPTATTGPAAVLTSLIGKNPFAVSLYPGGNASGQMVHTFSGSLTNYRESAASSDAVKFGFSILADGEVTTSAV